MGNAEFETIVRRRYGARYNLTKDVDGYYASEPVKRMHEMWCVAKGIIPIDTPTDKPKPKWFVK